MSQRNFTALLKFRCDMLLTGFAQWQARNGFARDVILSMPVSASAYSHIYLFSIKRRNYKVFLHPSPPNSNMPSTQSHRPKRRHIDIDPFVSDVDSELPSRSPTPKRRGRRPLPSGGGRMRRYLVSQHPRTTESTSTRLSGNEDDSSNEEDRGDRTTNSEPSLKRQKKNQ